MGATLGMKGAIERWVQAVRLDGWANLFTGLGNVTRDKTRATRFSAAAQLDDGTIEALFSDNDLAARVCELVPEEMMRPGFDLVCEENPKTADVMKRWAELEAHAAVTDAMTWGRAFGGGAVYMGVEDGLDEHLPIDIAKVRRVDFLTALDRRELHVERNYEDPRAPKFGKPELYRIVSQRSNPGGASSDQFLIHESRLMVFGGARTTNWQRRQLKGWDLSVLQRVHEVLLQFGMTWDGVAHLMSDIAQAVYKMKGLADATSSDDEAILQKRFEMMELGRSVVRAIVLDADSEDFERKPTPLTGVPDVMQLFVLRYAAAAGMPATLAFGQSPAGMNATGESDTRHFYNRVDADRQNRLKPKLLQLFRLLWAEQGGEPKSWDLAFKPMWEPTAKEAADMRKSQADADVAYVREGVLLAEEVALARFGERGWSPETRIDLDARKVMLAASTKHAIENAKNPPEPPDPGGDPADPAPPADE